MSRQSDRKHPPSPEPRATGAIVPDALYRLDEVKARMGWRDAASLGVLMNTRGLMELIVLNIGLDLGVISPTLFAMMVLMALVTTIATTPVLRLIIRPEAWE